MLFRKIYEQGLNFYKAEGLLRNFTLFIALYSAFSHNLIQIIIWFSCSLLFFYRPITHGYLLQTKHYQKWAKFLNAKKTRLQKQIDTPISPRQIAWNHEEIKYIESIQKGTNNKHV